jgi:acetyltransferase
MEQTRIYRALQGVRGRQPVNLAEFEELLVRFSQLVAEQRWIKEIDINPLLASPTRMLALDARIVLHPPDATFERLPRLAIRPYPVQYVTQFQLKKGQHVTVRPIRPEDEPLMIRFHQSLSDRTVYYRYFTSLRIEQRISHERLARLCFIDYDREMALVAERQQPNSTAPEIIGIGRLNKLHGANEAEFALAISDRCQCQGLGTYLLERLVEIARDEKLDRIVATILADNRTMRRVA